MRRYGMPPRKDKTYIRRPGAYAVLLQGESVLLTHQLEPDNEFQLPGGGIDAGENPITALHREVYEETGYTMAEPRRLGAFKRCVYMPEYDIWAEKICAIYLARPVRRLGPPTEAGHTAVWVPLIAAPSVLGNPGDRAFVQDVILGL